MFEPKAPSYCSSSNISSSSSSSSSGGCGGGSSRNIIIIISSSSSSTFMLIDVAIPGDRNVIMKEAEKILIYKDLIKEIQRIRSVKANVIPVKKGATGTISESLRQYLNHIPGKHEIKELQNNSHKVLM